MTGKIPLQIKLIKKKINKLLSIQQKLKPFQNKNKRKNNIPTRQIKYFNNFFFFLVDTRFSDI